jgi:hypothetical protein
MLRALLVLLWLVPSIAVAQTPDPPLQQFLEARVPDELAVEGIVLAQRDLGIVIEEVGDALLISLVVHSTGAVVASMKVAFPASDREASLAIVTQVTATMYGQYTALPPSTPADVRSNSPVDTSPLRLARPHERSGLTFDVGFGISRAGGSTGSSPELALGIGIGTWIYPSKVALLGRIAMSTVDQSQVSSVSPSYVANEFIGANIQYWIDDHLWVAGGPGFVAFSAAETYNSIFPTRSACSPDCLGAGLDLRAGYSLGIGAHQLDLSLEAIAGYYTNDPSYALHVSSDSTGPAQSGATTTLMALIGYRFL